MSSREASQREHARMEILKGQIVLVEYGPMRLSIHAFEDEKPLIDLAVEGGRLAFRVLEDLARSLPVVRRKAHELRANEAASDVVRRMIEATQKMGAPDLTPLAAVAGAVADVVADFLIGQGGTKIIVDNGGDIALRLKEGNVARVGIRTDIRAKNLAYLLLISSEMSIGGVATSGLGGRSFTKGIASAATVISHDASSADAAATVIGNATNVESPNIFRCTAETIYPDTDIPKEWVTVSVGKLSLRKIERALENGLSQAYALYHRDLIQGAFIAVQGRVVSTDSVKPMLTQL